MSEKNVYFFIKALSLIGIILAVYLLWQQIFHPPFQLCTINTTINCEAIISGTVAKTFGIPTPIYGLIGYILLFFSALYHKKKVLMSVASFGLVFCLWIAYQELFQLRVICPICIFCQIIMLTVFSLSFIQIKRPHDT